MHRVFARAEIRPTRSRVRAGISIYIYNIYVGLAPGEPRRLQREGARRRARGEPPPRRVNPRLVRVRVRVLRGQSLIRYSLPPPGSSETGIHLASATGIPLGFH